MIAVNEILVYILYFFNSMWNTVIYETINYVVMLQNQLQVFNFDPAAMVQAPGHHSSKIEEDMTKLCNHRRKVDAMAALCQSMQPSQLPPPAQATGIAS